MRDNDIDLAKEHIELAENIVIEQGKNSDGKKKKALERAAFALEKAEVDLEESEE